MEEKHDRMVCRTFSLRMKSQAEPSMQNPGKSIPRNRTHAGLKHRDILAVREIVEKTPLATKGRQLERESQEPA